MKARRQDIVVIKKEPKESYKKDIAIQKISKKK